MGGYKYVFYSIIIIIIQLLAGLALHFCRRLYNTIWEFSIYRLIRGRRGCRELNPGGIRANKLTDQPPR